MGNLFIAIWVSCMVIITCEEIFLEQPEPVLAPLGTQIKLTCRVAMGYRIVWIIGVPGVGEVNAEESGAISYLSSRGIETEVSSAENFEPTLTINGTVENNQTTVQCRAVNINNFTRFDGDVVTVTFYGPPSTPADLAATENGVGSLNISWSLVTIEGVAVTFTVTLTNLNESSTGPMEVSGIQEQHYIFTLYDLEDSTSCDVYSFQVTVVNCAGTGTPSEIITRSLPSLPDISPVQDSLQHSLVRTASGVTLSVTCNGATSCPDYPVTNHTLVLIESSTSEMIKMEETSDHLSLLAEKYVKENSMYSYHVFVINEAGTVQSTQVQIVTTDVQGVNFTRIDENIYFIQCSYLSGSDVSGCIYVLVSGEEGVENVTGFIERDSNGVTLEMANIGCYSEVLAYDDSIGSLPVRTNISSESCPRPATSGINTSPKGSKGPDFVSIVVGALVSIMAAVVAVIIVVVGISLYKWKKYSSVRSFVDDKSCGVTLTSAPPSHSPIDPPCDPAQLTTNKNYAEVQLKSKHTNTTTQQYAVIAPQPAVASSLPKQWCPSTPPSETPRNSTPPTVDENYAMVQNKIGHPNTTTAVIAPLPAVAPSLPPPRRPSSHFPSDRAPPSVDENYAEVQNKTGHPNTTQLYAVIAPLPAVAPSLPPSQCPSTLSSQFPSYPAPPIVDENYAEVENKTGHPNSTQLYAVIAPLPAFAPSLPPPGYPSTPPSHSPSDPAPSTVDAMVKQNTVNPPDQDHIYNILEDPNKRPPPLPANRYPVDPNAPDIPAYSPALQNQKIPTP